MIMFLCILFAVLTIVFYCLYDKNIGIYENIHNIDKILGRKNESLKGADNI